MSFLARFKSLDVYRDIPKDLKSEATLTGAVVSVTCVLAMIYLFLSELIVVLTPEVTSEMMVDNRELGVVAGEDHALFQINMNITVPAVPCAVLSVDAQDVMGSHVVDVGGHLKKTRVSSETMQPILDKRTGKEMSPDADPITQKGEGCNVHGDMIVKRVPGNFHVSAHAHAHLLNLFFQNEPMNLTHYIHSLSFGEHKEAIFDVESQTINPLGNTKKLILEQRENEPKSYEYYIKIVPMVYERFGHTYDSFQYVSNSNEILGRYAIPAIYFRYELSPITVKWTRRTRSKSHFVVQICAIIGGVFTVFSLLNAFLIRSIALIKAEQGKLG